MRFRFRTLFLAAVLIWLPGARSAEPPPRVQFHPPGMWCWDNWFAHDGTKWHVFYLEQPKAVDPEHRRLNTDFYKHVGHAVSSDLAMWEDQGPAVCAIAGTWNDRHIATGSIARHEGRWWMFFTGRGTKGDGVGLALSDDLTSWKVEPEPLFSLSGTFAKEGSGVFDSEWAGERRRWIGISDPFILPEPQGEWHYLVLCARVLDVPLAESGCLAMVRSRDLRHWEAAAIVAWPRCFERMETPQLWQRHSRWYLSFGGVLDMAWVKEHEAALPAAVRGQHTHQNYCYSLAALQGPARGEELHHIATPPGHYIMKVLPAGEGKDVALFTVTVKGNSGISASYPLHYADDGGIQLEVQ